MTLIGTQANKREKMNLLFETRSIKNKGIFPLVFGAGVV
jgi:hypothetical protein